MGYIEQTLTTGEQVLFRTRLHWTVLFWPFMTAVVFGLGAVASFAFGAASVGQWAIGLVILGLACTVIAGVGLITGLVRRASTEMAVTNRRVLMKSGVFGRRTVELMLAKVESVGVDQGVLGRMAGYGTVVVRGTGGTHELFDRIAHPLEFRRHVQEQIERIGAPPNAPAPTTGAYDPSDYQPRP